MLFFKKMGKFSWISLQVSTFFNQQIIHSCYKPTFCKRYILITAYLFLLSVNGSLYSLFSSPLPSNIFISSSVLPPLRLNTLLQRIDTFKRGKTKVFCYSSLSKRFLASIKDTAFSLDPEKYFLAGIKEFYRHPLNGENPQFFTVYGHYIIC